MLSERQARILAALADATAPVTGRELALLLGVSLRTVQGDIARINRSHAVVRSTNRGYAVNRDALDAFFSGDQASPDPSIAHSALQILLFEGKQRVDDLSEALYVSTPTLERHLRTLGSLLKPCGLTLARKGGWVWIEGSEGGKRQLIGSLVARETDGSLPGGSAAASIFDSMDPEVLRSIVTSTIASFDYRIRPGFEENLMGSIAVALYRMRTDAHMMDQRDASSAMDDARIEYRIAGELCRRYSTHLGIEPNFDDQTYLAHLLRGQIEFVKRGAESANPRMGMPDFVREVEDIVRDVLESFSLRIASMQSVYNFAMHVDALLCRSTEAQIQSEEVLENVKRHMPFVYEIALLVSDRIARHFGISISNGEVGFICIHMGMILHSTMDEEQVGIGLTCQDYQGIAERVREGINGRFSETVTLYDLGLPITTEEVAALPIDLVVTTQRPRGLVIETVEVSPFFSTSDLIAVEDAVSACLKRKRAARVRRLVRTHLSEELFFKTDAVATKHDAITFLGSKLHEFGVVDDGFTESVLQREELSSTCFFELFAIPHALEMDAKRTMMAILVSERGIVWDKAPIHIVLMISVNRGDRKEFVELYNSMVKSLCDSRKVARIVGADTLEEFIAELDRE